MFREPHVPALKPTVSFRGQAVLKPLAERGDSIGAAARRDLARYYGLLDAYLPIDLSAGEARLLSDAVAPLLLETPPLASWQWLPAALAESLRTRLPNPEAPEPSATLLARIRSLGAIETQALVDALERYQLALARGARDSDALLVDIGLIPATHDPTVSAADLR